MVMKDLPIYNVMLTDDDETGVDLVSLVDDPAVQRDFLKFSEHTKPLKFSIDDEEKHIVTGLIMSCDTPIYRYEAGSEFYVVFPRETILELMLRFVNSDGTKSSNLNHAQGVDGVRMFESYIKDSPRGISPQGFEDIPEGSWFGSFKIDNPEVWDSIKSGEYNGFSIEGTFLLEEQEGEIDTIEQLINSLKNE